MFGTVLHRRKRPEETQLRKTVLQSSRPVSPHDSKSHDLSLPAQQVSGECRPARTRQRTRRLRLHPRMRESAGVEKAAGMISNHEVWDEKG